jgi:cytosine deaminase
MSGQEDIAEVFELVTRRAARTLGVADRYGIEEGKPASFVVFDASSISETLRLNPARLRVFKDGDLVATTEPSKSAIHRGGVSEGMSFSPSKSSSGRR